METIGIYKISSPSKRIYIGQSSNIKKRFESYKTLLKSKNLIKLYRSFLKYGINNHVFEIIEECSIELLNERERYWQDFYNVLGKQGLNCRLTSSKDKFGKLSEGTKKKIGIGNKGKIMSDAAKQQISITKKSKPISNSHKEKLLQNIKKALEKNDYSHTRTKEAIERAKLKMNKIRKNCITPIAQYDLDGKFIRNWEKISDAASFYKISNSCFSNHLKGRNKTCKGFIWKKITNN